MDIALERPLGEKVHIWLGSSLGERWIYGWRVYWRIGGYVAGEFTGIGGYIAG